MKQIRGYLALSTVCVGMLLSDLVQRLVIGPWLWLRPQSRHGVLGRWLQFLAWLVTRPLEVIGGASLPRPQRVVPCKPGILIIINHQSLLDIPLGVEALQDGYLSLVTRRRYTRFIPLISHLVRLFRYPSIDPEADPRAGRRMLKSLRKAALESDVPILIYPEGTRTRDGEIGPFRRTGMRVLLRSRTWTVHAFVVDGLWEHAKFKHLMGNMNTIDARMAHVGAFEWTDAKGDDEAFVSEIRQRMIEKLAEMRGLAAS